MASSEPAQERTILGHPSGLFVLFFAELWERFCYYGMRALLAIYIAEQFFAHQSDEAAAASASESYGGFTAMVYALGIFGGAIADRVLGYRRSIITGGILMAIGEFMLLVPDKTMFFFGLATLIVGNGMFKPNISTLVGKLYKQGDPRRDGGFTIFYMGINVGALLAPIACQSFASYMGSYRYGFMLAGAGMLLGVLVFGLGRGKLHGQGLPPKGKESFMPILQVLAGCAVVIPGVYFMLSADTTILEYSLYAVYAAMLVFLASIALKEAPQVRDQMFVLLGLLLLCTVFWAGFEQAGASLNFFAQGKLVPLSVGSWDMPFEWWQSVNAVFVVALGPIFAAMWVALDRAGKNPSIPAKFALGLILMGLGFAVLNAGIARADSDAKVMWYFLAGLYFVHTCGELCLSPVGLSAVTKLAPERMTGMIMGAWFIAIATGNYLAGKISAIAANKAAAGTTDVEKLNAYGDVFQMVLFLGVGLGGLFLVLSPFLNKKLHGVK